MCQKNQIIGLRLRHKHFVKGIVVPRGIFRTHERLQCKNMPFPNFKLNLTMLVMIQITSQSLIRISLASVGSPKEYWLMYSP